MRSKVRLHDTMTTEEVNLYNSFSSDLFCLQDRFSSTVCNTHETGCDN
jgi:hypothetical protein